MKIIITIRDFKVELEDSSTYSILGSGVTDVKEIISLTVKEYNSIEKV
jgi:hypothetical protein